MSGRMARRPSIEGLGLEGDLDEMDASRSPQPEGWTPGVRPPPEPSWSPRCWSPRSGFSNRNREINSDLAEIDDPAHNRRMIGLPEKDADDTPAQELYEPVHEAAEQYQLFRSVPTDRDECFRLAAQLINDGLTGRPLRCIVSRSPAMERFASSSLGHAVKVGVALIARRSLMMVWCWQWLIWLLLVLDMLWHPNDWLSCSFASIFLLYGVYKCALHGEGLAYYFYFWNKVK